LGAKNSEIVDFIKCLKEKYPDLTPKIIPKERVELSIEKQHYHIQAGRI
jgi:hypothetical protein